MWGQTQLFLYAHTGPPFHCVRVHRSPTAGPADRSLNPDRSTVRLQVPGPSVEPWAWALLSARAGDTPLSLTLRDPAGRDSVALS